MLLVSNILVIKLGRKMSRMESVTRFFSNIKFSVYFTHPGCDLSIDPVLVLVILRTAKLRQHGHKGGEVQEGGHRREPELLQRRLS
jgi:hypothetical protein